VRHRRGALLALRKRLLDLADLGLLQPADFQRELLQRRGADGQRAQELGVPVPLNDLRRHRRGREAERPAGVGLDGRRQMREGADRSGQLADRDPLACSTEAGDVTRQLRVPQRQLQSERHRLGVHAVRPSDHRCAAVFLGPGANGVHQSVDSPQHEVAGLANLQRLGGVDDVRGGQAEMKPASRRADVLRHRRRERDDVVLRNLFDFFDAGDVECAALANVPGRFGGNDAGARHGVCGCDLNLQPCLVLALVAPDATHLGVRVPLDHRVNRPG
jgi:hypothetical protein